MFSTDNKPIISPLWKPRGETSSTLTFDLQQKAYELFPVWGSDEEDKQTNSTTQTWVGKNRRMIKLIWWKVSLILLSVMSNGLSHALQIADFKCSKKKRKKGAVQRNVYCRNKYSCLLTCVLSFLVLNPSTRLSNLNQENWQDDIKTSWDKQKHLQLWKLLKNKINK